MAFSYRDIERAFHEHTLHIFCIGWMDCRDAFRAVHCLYCCVTDKTYVAEYEEYWLIGAPIINPPAILSFEAVCVN